MIIFTSMVNENNERQIVKILKEICKEAGYKIETYSDNWAIKINNGKSDMYVYGYKFPNNSGATEHICNDKALVSDILKEHNVPRVTHDFFMKKTNRNIVGILDKWDEVESLFKKYNSYVVVKPNDGTCGVGVKRAKTIDELKEVVESLLEHNFTIAISPFEEILNEYRLIMLDGKPMLVFRKVRPFVLGNGKDTLQTLIDNKFGDGSTSFDKTLDLDFVPKANEKVNLLWKHNLCGGAVPEVVNDDIIKTRLMEVAENACRVLKAHFVSVDIVDTMEGLKVLEINSGVCMENFSSSSKENYNTAKAIYAKAIESYFSRIK